jgi:hypothetical protein
MSWYGLNWSSSGWRPAECSCEHHNETLGSIKFRELFRNSQRQILKTDSDPQCHFTGHDGLLQMSYVPSWPSVHLSQQCIQRGADTSLAFQIAAIFILIILSLHHSYCFYISDLSLINVAWLFNVCCRSKMKRIGCIINDILDMRKVST